MVVQQAELQQFRGFSNKLAEQFLQKLQSLVFRNDPGAIGSFGYSGTVHPQEPTALAITSGVFPVLVSLNSQ
jgi:hypothetical protein